MKILITGATGFIGKHLVPALRERGHDILVYTRAEELAQNVFSNSVTYLNGDSPIPYIEGVIHLAGEPIMRRWTNEVKRKIYSSRVDGAKSLIDRIVNRTSTPQPKFFISASASGSGFLGRVCEDWESAVLSRTDLHARKVILRKAPVLGREGGMLPKIMLPFRAGLGGRCGDGKQWMNWVHIEDAVAMYLRLVEDQNLSGVFVGAAPEPITNEEFTRTLAHVMNRPNFVSIPNWTLKLLLGEVANIFLQSERAVPERFLDLNFPYRFRTLDFALSDLVGERKVPPKEQAYRSAA